MSARRKRKTSCDSAASEPATRSRRKEDESVFPSGDSLKSNASMHMPPKFSAEKPESSQTSAAESVFPSGDSLKSDASMHMPPKFSAEKPESDLQGEQLSRSVGSENLEDPVLLTWDESDSVGNFLSKIKHLFKDEMKKKFTTTSEGNGDHWSSLDKIYTELHIIPGESEEPLGEHEFSHLERKLKVSKSCKITLNNIFRPLHGQEKGQTVVLTKGNAGIGKSFSVQKFILDWAKGDANKDLDFVFYLPFREINLCTDMKSLHMLLTEFHPALNNLKNPEHYAKAKIAVILDGLDESRLDLEFENIKKITSLSEVTHLKVVLANLIQKNLLPEANIWITSRASAASQIPTKYVHMVTEIRGFNDAQKKEYFKKRFSANLSLAGRITSHIESSHSLDIMCQIPIFCWISAILFQDVFDGDKNVEVPQTLTEMMAHYLFVQSKRRSTKYDTMAAKKEVNFLETQREFLLKLGKLAFVHLQRNSLIFYEEDLEDCGIDLAEASIYSGFCTTVLREENVFSQRKVFFFVHLTIQEFFAAMYVYDFLTTKKTTELNTTELGKFLQLEDKDYTVLELLKLTVETVLKKGKGHLTYFLQFLLGLMVEANRRVLQYLLKSPDTSQDVEKKILTYLKSIRRKTLSPDNSITLFRIMVEMRDQKVKDEIQEYLKTKDFEIKLTLLHCSALAFMLQVSKSDLDILDLKSYNTSEEGRRRLIPAMRSSKKAILADCDVTTEWVEHMVFSLKFPSSPLRALDLSNNDLHDLGVEQLCQGLSSHCCRLKILRLSGCLVTENGCSFLASALTSNPSHLSELDLSYNHPGDSGINLLIELKNDPQFQLSKLNVDHCGSLQMQPGFKKYACELSLDPQTAHKNLLLSKSNRQVTWVTEEQSYPDYPERFDQFPQVLCLQGLNGRYYWEVQVSEPFNVGVTYTTIGRKGDMDDCKLGLSENSWSLSCSSNGCFILHSNTKISVASLCQRSTRVGVYLDWSTGTLSFYRVTSDKRVHLHTFRETFTEPLYPAVELSAAQSSAFFCKLQ
ncbi:NACHT, LRR and PYD domains-containing protein 5-like isoform X2 [Solea solea]|uniref:NACHT, LRR and PYD domains-containing protein 5-like isoform X2 n=1 Tax=Solea solea TaxID=90069 RepID=UPI00272ADD1D|nr:NACHT, LRR and PYD domains-containing protein 5-like isoform X2 [Solea solea]